MSSRKFIVLEDFDAAYNAFELYHPGEKFIELPHKLTLPLRKQVEEVKIISNDLIYREIENQIYGKYFLVTLDAGSYFENYDFSFEVSRTCVKEKDITTGSVIRLPRPGCEPFIQQAQNLRNMYEKSDFKKPIALCDDGIGTGGSLKAAINIFQQAGICIDRIFVLLNPGCINKIGETSVHTIFNFDEPYEWLSQRDLIWGLPRSGLSYSSSDDLSNIKGIPYTIDNALITRKIASFFGVSVFRRDIININIDFWSRLEVLHKRPLYLEDCPRISCLSKFFGENKRVIELLKEIRHDDYTFP